MTATRVAASGAFSASLFGGDENREDHDVYAESVRRGHYVLAFDAKSDDELDRASDIINQYNPVDIDERSSAWRQQGWQGYDASAPRFTQDEIARDRSNLQNEARIPIVEEELKVGKREFQRGGIRVVKRAQEKPVNESVQLRDGHIKVERRPVSKDSSRVGNDAFKEKSFELRESAEEAVVSKNARVVDEVVVGKEVSQHTENIQDSVRRTDVDIEQLGGPDLREGTMNTSDDNDFRGHWQSNFGSGGGRYEDYSPAYSHGSTLAGNDGITIGAGKKSSRKHAATGKPAIPAVTGTASRTPSDTALSVCLPTGVVIESLCRRNGAANLA